MASHFMESMINSQQLDDDIAESDTESDIDIDTEQQHISSDDILDEARPRSTEPTGNETGGCSTVFKTFEVENLTEYTGLKDFH